MKKSFSKLYFPLLFMAPLLISASEHPKIPLTIGFANLVGEELNSIETEDAKALSPLFMRSRIVAAHQIPSAEVLFIYAHLKEDGTIEGTKGAGVRQIVELTHAAIIVVASPNSVISIKKAAALPGSKKANIVFTLDRNGVGFSRFFAELFIRMRSGTDMPVAWAELAPQTPKAMPTYAPATILLVEAGRIRFPQ